MIADFADVALPSGPISTRPVPETCVLCGNPLADQRFLDPIQHCEFCEECYRRCDDNPDIDPEEGS